MSGYVYRLTRVASLQNGTWERDSISSWVSKSHIAKGPQHRKITLAILQPIYYNCILNNLWLKEFGICDLLQSIPQKYWWGIDGTRAIKSDHHWRSRTGMQKSLTWTSLLFCTRETFKVEVKWWEHWPSSVIFLQFHIRLEWDKGLVFTKATWLLQCSLAVWCSYCLSYVRVLSTLLSRWILTWLLFLCLGLGTLGSCTLQNN